MLGVGAMLGRLGGNEETVMAIKGSLEKTIAKVRINDNHLQMTFTDETVLDLFDDGQSCCETRYMRTDDDLNDFVGAVFTGIELKDAPNIKYEDDDDYGETHEVQFLEITTNKGSFVCSSHNQHNGYYGGFWIIARLNNSL